MWLLVVLLLLFLLGSKFREGLTSSYKEYDEQSCLALATQNKNNITALQTALDKVLALQDQVTNIENSVSSNTSTLQTLTDQVTSTIK